MTSSSKTKIRIILVSVIVLMFGNSGLTAAESLDLELNPSLNLNPIDAVKGAGIKSMGAGDILKGFKLDLPLNLNKINIDTNTPMSPTKIQQDIPDIDLRQFLTPKNISSNDLGGAVKAIAVLVIEIFLAVVSILSQILKLVLELLK